MGKPPYAYTDSETEETSSSSLENVKQKKNFSILKYRNGNVKKKKCKLHTKSEPDDSDYRNRSRSQSSQRVRYKLPGILKNNRVRDRYSSDEDEDSEPVRPPPSQDRCLVGRVPLPPGAKPGRGGGVAIIIRKNLSSVPQQESSNIKKGKSSRKWLVKKRSY